MTPPELAKIKKYLGELAPPAPAAARAFKEALPSLSILVYEKTVAEADYCDEHCPPEKLRVIKEAGEFLGGTLSASYELGLYEPLAEEFGWYASFLGNRGFAEEHVLDTVAAWVNGIYFKTEPPASEELSRPLKLIMEHLPALTAEARSASPPTPAVRNLAEILRKGDRGRAGDFISDLLEKDTPLDAIVEDVLLPSLREIGTLWQNNRLSVAEEHAAAEICRDIIGRFASAGPAAKHRRRSALLSCVPGEEHELGARAMAALMEARGWQVYYLGRGLPAVDLARATAARKPDVVFLSATMMANLPAARAAAAAVRDGRPDAKIILGGRAAALGCEKLADVADAVALEIKSVYAAAEELAG
jgi:methanogenic corrinoid protein MtbC1